MKLGLCLAGGGAKGSYQAGVIKALSDRGIKDFYSISGTSIGAINGYYIFTENVENLEKVWINIQKTRENAISIVDNTVDNSEVIDKLYDLNNNSSSKMNFYVNYLEVEKSMLKEKVVNLSNMGEEGIQAIKYSALLPFNPNGKLGLKDQFKEDLKAGMYDGYKLDGGLVNNTLLKPLIVDKVDKIILISTDYEYTLPDEIKNEYNEDNIIIVKPGTPFEKKDTLRFESEFCKGKYQEGYEIGTNLVINF